MWCRKLTARTKKKKKNGEKRETKEGPLFLGPATGADNHRIGDHRLGDETS